MWGLRGLQARCTIVIALAVSLVQLSSAVKPEEVDGAVLGEHGLYQVQHGSSVWTVHHDQASEQVYFHNEATNATQWNDPRIHVLPGTKQPERTSSLPIFLVATVPVLGFASFMAARIWYLQTYYPELLYPAKERKDRKQKANWKTKGLKSRGKLNQDGKGGSSSN